MQINLFCIPHAGGSAYAYTRWNQYLNSKIHLIPVELSGRGRRMREPLYNSFYEAVEDIINSIKMKLYESQYVIFGHSMGSTLAYELLCEILSEGLPLPKHTIFSGRHPPIYNDLFDKIHNLPIEDFKKEIIELGGTTNDIFSNKELCDMFLPIMRSDYKMLENYSYAREGLRLPIDISVFMGSMDNPEHHSKMDEWRNFTEKSFNLYEFEGTHFFIFEKEKEVVNTINKICV